MPVYEYQCQACQRDFEYQQRMTEPEKTTCEVCGGALDRLISRTAFALKGAGWYKDLYSKSDGSFDPRKGKDYDAKEAKDKAADPAKADAAKTKGTTDAGSSSSGSDSSSSGGGASSSGSGSSSSTSKAS